MGSCVRWRKMGYRILSVILGVGLMLPQVLSVRAEEMDMTQETDESVMEETLVSETIFEKDLEEAAEELQILLKEQRVAAMVYLCDAYDMKEEPDTDSLNVYTLPGGQTVYLKNVVVDEDGRIWFQVTYETDYEVLEGYVARENLAYSDERVLEWENQYVQSVFAFWGFYGEGVINTRDVEQFPESYQDGLLELKRIHPNWVFVPFQTGLDWNAVVQAESEPGRNLIHAANALDSWKNGMYDRTYANVSTGILKYYLDPRNFLNEKGIFQFEQLTYNGSYHTVAATQAILNGTFMNGRIEADQELTYAQAFTTVGADSKVSPFLLASRVRQEQGTAGTSPLISGTYAGYENLYNYYNIGASGKTDKEVIESGLTKAREMGWTTRLLSLQGGSKFLVNSYVFQGQDTLYLQKFDVDSSYNGCFWHQYMQNIQAPSSEAVSTYKAYEKCGVLNSAFVFRIPVYRNMPQGACQQPTDKDEITLKETEIQDLPVGANATLSAFVNEKPAVGVELQFTSSDASIASVDEDGVVTAITPGTTTISCTKENGTTATCRVTVIKADITSYEIPKLEAVTYHPDLTLEKVELPKGWTWVDKGIVPVVDNKGYNASYTPDDARYNAITVSIQLPVEKAVPTEYEIPTGLEGVYGTELSSVALPTDFAWENPEEKLEVLGENTYTASYNPDVFNYESAEGIEVKITVICTNHKYGEWEIVQEPKCEEEGSKERSCEVCGEKEIMMMPEAGHHMEAGVCTECGYTESTPEPDPEPTPEPDPEPTPEPDPEPTPEPDPEPTPKPTPEPTPEPKPEPKPEPAPSPAPQPPTPKPPQVEPPKTEMPVQAEQPKAEQPKAEQPQAEQPQAEQPRQEQPKKSETKPKQPQESTEPEVQKIDMTDTSVMMTSQLQNIQGKNQKLELEMSDRISWTVYGNAITSLPNDGIDMGVTIGADVIPIKTIQELAGKCDTLTLSLAHDGEFGFEAEMSVAVGKAYSGKIANLFYFNPDSGKLEYVMECPVTEEGTASFTFRHASDYLLVMAEESMEKTDQDASDKSGLTQEDITEITVQQEKETTAFSRKLLLIAGLVLVGVIVGSLGIFFALRKPGQLLEEYEANEEDIIDMDGEEEDDWLDT